MALLIFGAFILIHELGHFFWARRFGVTVIEFSIGMGPKLISKVSEKTGTRWSLRLFPVGGFVSMAGEEEDSDDPDSLDRKPVWQRGMIMAAGAAMNLLLGVILMCAVSATAESLGSTRIYGFTSEDAKTYLSGLRTDDRIISVGRARVHTATELVYEIMYGGTKPLDITVERDGETIVIEDVEFPTFTEAGLTFGNVDFFVWPEEKNFVNVVKQSWFNSMSSMKMIWTSIIDLMRGKYGLDDMSGPVGVTTAISEAADEGAYDLLYLCAVITLNLGIFNLLPFPALDGGQIFFLIIELIRRKPVPRKIQGYINMAGLALLLLLMVVVTFKDILKLIN